MLLSGNRKNRLFGLSLIAILLVVGITAAKAGTIEVKLECPSTISPGNTLSIKLNLTNHQHAGHANLDVVPVVVAKSGMVVHLGNLDIRGPFVIPFEVTLDPGQESTVDYLDASFPSDAPKGIFSNIVIILFDEKNKVIGDGACLVEVQ